MPMPRERAVGLVLAVLALLALGLGATPTATAQEVPVEPVEAAPLAVEEPPPPDTVPPVIAQPSDVVAAAVDASGAVVAYAAPGASDNVDGAVAVACAPASGSLFPLGTTPVTCSAADAAGNWASVAFAVTVVDATPPVIAQPSDVVAAAADASGAVVAYAAPGASDNVDGAVAVGCAPASGSLFPVGTTPVTCGAQDATGNVAQPVTFRVTVNPPPVPTATATPATPTATDPTATATDPTATATADSGSAATPTATGEPTAAATPGSGGEPTGSSGTPSGTTTLDAAGSTEVLAAPDPVDPIPAAPVPAALSLPGPPPPDLVLVTGSGPIDGLSAIWGYQDFTISQEYGHTAFSLANFSWYRYGIDYGLDGYAHPGLDVGMPAGTPLYSPVNGTVKIAGGVPYYTFYGNGEPGVGELLIETDDGDEVVLGHMGLILVKEGQRVKPGEFVGLAGGLNGDHLHLETRELQSGGGFLAVDPRQSFLIPALEAAARAADSDEPVDALDPLEVATEFGSENAAGTLELDEPTESTGASELDTADGLKPDEPVSSPDEAPADEPLAVVSLDAARLPNGQKSDLPPPTG